ncbi:hypothetical protein [Fusobacterium sp.]|uniref:hypothetical protein n=1 Tax=Fusobacterium sp. TaxID=68766 RepID=UPI0026147614|nr:hypothetical protein [Fusobacterium sp.]
MGVIIKFLKYFICKWFGTVAVEKIVIILLKELVKRTDSKVDDEIFEEVFNKTKGVTYE